MVGVEKMTDSPLSEITASLATAADADLEVDLGVSFVALNALVMQRYMHEYNWKTTDFAAFSINAHANAVSNPNARFQKAITMMDYERAGMVCEPINLLDASPVSDGAAAILITSKKPSSGKTVSVAASASATDTISLQNRPNPLRLTAAEKSARAAYQQAGISPQDIDLFEYHDAFSIMAALSLEAAGFCAPGQAPKLANEGNSHTILAQWGTESRGTPSAPPVLIVELVNCAVRLENQVSGPLGWNRIWRVSSNITTTYCIRMNILW